MVKGKGGGGEQRAGRRRALLRLSRLGALATLLFPSASRADDGYPNVGLFVGYTFGERPSIEWGIQASYVVLTKGHRSCTPSTLERRGFGPLAQVSLLGLSRPRFTLGGFYGAEIDAAGPSVLGELGASLRLDHGANWGVHVGELFEATWPYAYARQEFFLQEYSFGAGASYAPMLGLPEQCLEPVPIAGRPQRDADGRAMPTFVDDVGLPNDALGWYRDAQAECTSIRAFLDLARELLAAGAPFALVERALDAAEDEVRHAQICADVASSLAGRAVRPMFVDSPLRPLPSRPELFARLGLESFVDGCLGEGAAALAASLSADRATDHLLAAAHSVIAVDEARHAELGWDIVSFALARGGDLVRRPLAEWLATHGPGDASEPVRFVAHRRLERLLV